MRPTPRKRWLVGLTLLAVLLFSAYLWLRPLLSIGGGYAAKHACSCHFLQGRVLDDISTQDLNFSVLGWYALTVEDSVVHSSFLSLVDREAKYLGSRGCVLINDRQRGLPSPPPPVGGDALTGYGTDAQVTETLESGLPPPQASRAYEAALDYGMQPVPGGEARGIVILKNGRLAAERYAAGFGPNTPMLGWSMTKTLTGLLVGALVGQDLRSLARPPREGLFPEIWADKRQNISLADLLHMNSGLGWNEGYGSITDATVMLHERPDFADFALRSPLIANPGTTWSYSSGTTNIIMEYLRREVGSNQALYALIDSLLAPAAPSLIIEPDQSGRPVGSSYGWATTRDWARLGQFMLQDGVWDGDTLLPPGWIDFMRQPAAGSDGTYGGHLWLPGPDMPSLPADAYMMRGFQDQRVFVIPSRKLVIARLGHGEDKAADFDGLISRILAADE